MHILSLLFLSAVSSVSSALPSAPHLGLSLSATPRGSKGGSVAGWYPAWLGSDWPPSNISWHKYNALAFAFAETTPDVHSLSLDDKSLLVLPEFMTLAKQNSVRVLLAIGGRTGSQYFSLAVATPENRMAFVKTVVGYVVKYQFDGLIFHWEYPGGSGLECNVASADDTVNYLTFFQALREDPVGKNLIISAAVGLNTFKGTDGKPMTDVSAFAEVLYDIVIMGDDVYGPWSTTAGPNSPLHDTCAPAAQQAGSIEDAVKTWTSAGFPANQIVLGIASYGHSFLVNSSSAFDASNKLALYPPSSGTPNGDKWDTVAGPDQCGTVIDHPGGIFTFWGLVDTGFLKPNGKHAHGVHYLYDNCTQTPYLYNKTSQVYVSFDDTHSFAVKGKFVLSNGLKGVAIWDVASDYQDILLDSIRKAVEAH